MWKVSDFTQLEQALSLKRWNKKTKKHTFVFWNAQNSHTTFTIIKEKQRNMEELSKIELHYHQNISRTNEKLNKNKKKIYLISFIRLFLFVIGVIGIIYYWSSGWLFVVIAAAIAFVPFFILVKSTMHCFIEKNTWKN